MGELSPTCAAAGIAFGEVERGEITKPRSGFEAPRGLPPEAAAPLASVTTVWELLRGTSIMLISESRCDKELA